MGKTNAMIGFRSRTMHSQPPPLTIGGTVLKESDDIAILRVTFNFKMASEKHLRTVYRAAYQRLGILRSLLVRCFRGFVLRVLEYCPAV